MDQGLLFLLVETIIMGPTTRVFILQGHLFISCLKYIQTNRKLLFQSVGPHVCSGNHILWNGDLSGDPPYQQYTGVFTQPGILTSEQHETTEATQQNLGLPTPQRGSGGGGIGTSRGAHHAMPKYGSSIYSDMNNTGDLHGDIEYGEIKGNDAVVGVVRYKTCGSLRNRGDSGGIQGYI